MQRREFLKASVMTGAIAASGSLSVIGADQANSKPLFYELRQYQTTSAELQGMVIDFLGKAAIPALNRLGIKPVGVFE